MASSMNKSADAKDLRPKITVIGIGGAGNNAVNNMIRANLQGVQYIVCNTDAQHLEQSLVDSDRRLQLGLEVTQGLGAGSRPEVGRAAAEESLEDVMRHMKGSNMVFITAGMGGGTGTGAAPVIAQCAREQGILTVGVVTKPFHFEGPHRMRVAEAGIKELEQYVDTLIIIPNQNLFRVATEKTTFADAFKMADNVLYSGVRGVTDLMIMPGLINLDFADIRAVMTEMGKAMMGTGEAGGDGRAIAAAEAAISNPLLDDVSMRGAKGVLINITGGLDMTLFEVDEAANRIREEIDSDATIDTNIIFGSTFDETMQGTIRVSVVATGIDSEEIKRRLSEAAAKKKDETDPYAAATHGFTSTGYVDPQTIDFSEAQESGDTQTYDFDSLNTAQSYMSQGEPEAPVNDDSFASSADDRASTSHSTVKKKSFFGRFMETISGKDSPETPEFEFAPRSEGRGRGSSDSQPTIIHDEMDEAELQDVPAYLRRKAK